MRVYKEVTNGFDFDFWGNARLHCERLTIKEQEQIIEALEDIYPNGISATELNDIFAFECDFIAETLGYKDWRDFCRNA